MNYKTLRALKGSIRKWQAIVDGHGIDQGGDNCPLCHLFLENADKDYCEGCPVFEKTGKEFCYGTPYHDEWLELPIRLTIGSINERRTPEDAEKARAAATAELEFLKSLLPEKKNEKL